MRKNSGKIFLLFTIIISMLSFLPSCRVVKHLPPGQTLLVQNKFILKAKVRSSERERMRADLPKIVAQKPNKKLLGFIPVRLWFYHAASRGKLTKFKQWIIDKVGEAPVVYDSLLLGKSCDLAGTYLFNSGYLNVIVKDTVITKNRKTKIFYSVYPYDAWRIGEIELPNGHTACDSIVRENRKGSLLHKGDQFNITNFNNESLRIETVLRNNGYFLFNRGYVKYNFDSITATKTVNIKIILNPPTESPLHQQFFIRDVQIIPDYSANLFSDTLRRDTVLLGGFKFISGKMKIRPKVLMEAVTFKHGDLYSKENETRTVNRLLQLGVFKFINIDYKKVDSASANYLDCIIELTTAKKQSYAWTLEGNVSDEGLFGTGGSLTYKNKNLTRGADQLIVTGAAGVQVRFTKPKGQKEQVQLMNITLSASATYYLNKFLIPFRAKLFSPRVNPKTRISLSYNFDHRFDFDTTGKGISFLYQLHNFNAAFGYEWNHGTQHHHLFNPITVEFFLLPKTGPAFSERLDQNPILKSSFEEQVIIGPNYTYTYTNQKTNSDKKYMFSRTTVETAGNLLDGIFKLASLNDQHDSLYLIANKPFAQYFRFEEDWRNYFRINNHSLFALRTYAGLGVPYGNSYALPFVKQFYVGGPNDLRGFQIREIGPGSYNADPTFSPETGPNRSNPATGFFDQSGDIKLEANAEIRFDIYRWLKAAFFADAGNVWTFKKDALPGGEFNIQKFWGQFAVDVGPGIRLDFNYFVVRFDYGFPIRDPRRSYGLRWQFQDGVAFTNGAFQLAIGYPF